MKSCVAKVFLYMFFLLIAGKEIRSMNAVLHTIKQYPKTRSSAFFLGVTGFCKLIHSTHRSFLEKKYALLNVQCTHNPNNTPDDFLSFGKQCKKHPNEYKNKQYNLLFNCMKGKDENLYNWNACVKAVSTITEESPKNNVESFNGQRYVK